MRLLLLCHYILNGTKYKQLFHECWPLSSSRKLVYIKTCFDLPVVCLQRTISNSASSLRTRFHSGLGRLGVCQGEDCTGSPFFLFKMVLESVFQAASPNGNDGRFNVCVFVVFVCGEGGGGEGRWGGGGEVLLFQSVQSGPHFPRGGLH